MFSVKTDERHRHKTGTPFFLSTPTVVGLLALVKFVIEFAVAGRYGIFRDELYYLACARHLSWGYVDHPPLIALMTWLTVHSLGTSLFALRFLPAVAGGLLVWLTAQIARDMDGGHFAQCFAAFTIIPVPLYLMFDHWLTMNAFEPLLWTSAVWMVVRMLSRNDPRYWLAIGVLCGIGVENKYSMFLLMAALVLGLLLTPQRRILGNRWFLLGAAVTFLLFLPNLLWLFRHDFPFLEFERNSRMSGSRIERAPLDFVADQIMIMSPLLAPLWAGGLVWLLFSRQAQRYRFMGWVFLGVFLVLLALKAKNYYVMPAYPMLLAAGSVAAEEITAVRACWARTVYAVAVLAAGGLLAPFVLPVLPLRGFLAYQRAFGGFTPVRFENLTPGLLPQHFADEFGWEDMARETGRVFNSLPRAEKKDTAVFANDYGEAAAIDFFGPKYGLPSAISNSESYWLWGPRGYTGKTVIVLGSDGHGDRDHFNTVAAAGHVDSPYARADEHFSIFVCRGLSVDLHRWWPKIKNW